jgi:hypothetical protein
MFHEKVPDSLKARLPEISDELREILEKIPSRDYVLDLDAVRPLSSNRSRRRNPAPRSQPSLSPFARDPLLSIGPESICVSPSDKANG